MEEKIKKDYLAGEKYKEICKKHSITPNQLKYLIAKNKWKRKSNRSKAQKGNKNAVGNKGGHAPKKNKNAVKTGEHENIFDTVINENEQNILNSKGIGRVEETILQEIKILTIREKRMLARIKELKEKNRDMTIMKIHKDKEGTSTDIEHTLHLINKIEEGLTRVQESKRRCIESFNKIGLDNERLKLEKERLKIEKKRLELELQKQDGEEIEDTTETDADLYGN